VSPRGVDTRSGHLAALFRWQSGKREQLENFCTEALASAIASEPTRFLALLEQHDMLPTGVRAAEVVEVEVATQGPTADRKLVDLQLKLELVSGPAVGVWVEIKVGTGLRPGQLHAYSTELARVFEDAPWRLLVLSKWPEQPADDNLRWQQVRATITDDAHQHWLDLRAFLEVKNVADVFDEDLTPTEFASVGPARTALCKTARAMAELSRRLDAAKSAGQPELWPRGFPADEQKIHKTIATTFRNGWGFVIGGDQYGARLRLGIRDTQDGPRAFVMIKTRKSHRKTRVRVWAALDSIAEPRFGPIDAGMMEARGVDKLLSELNGQDALVDWWFSMLKALANGGALQLCGGGFNDEETANASEADDDEPGASEIM
jgi:hypothetical protein